MIFKKVANLPIVITCFLNIASIYREKSNWENVRKQTKYSTADYDVLLLPRAHTRNVNDKKRIIYTKKYAENIFLLVHLIALLPIQAQNHQYQIEKM